MAPPNAPSPGNGSTPAVRMELTTGAIAAGGGCVARAEDGRVVFVRHSLPGERVVAQVTSETTSFLRADAVEVLEPSADRVPAPCPLAGPGRCGGCDFQHVAVPVQRTLKESLVAEQLRRVAGLDRVVTVEEVAGSPDGLGWRTRVRFAVDRAGRVGLHRHRSHDDRAGGPLPAGHRGRRRGGGRRGPLGGRPPRRGDRRPRGAVTGGGGGDGTTPLGGSPHRPGRVGGQRPHPTATRPGPVPGGYGRGSG